MSYTEEQLEFGGINATSGGTQCERVLAWLKRRPLDPLTAWQELGVYRLSARINDLKRRGWDIDTDTLVVTNRYGEKVEVAKYVLVGRKGEVPQ